MKVTEFDYPLPEELIAQAPLAERDASRLLVVDRATGSITHSQFRDISQFLAPQDLLVFNESKVLHARLLGQRSSGGKVEIFLLRPLGNKRFECLVKATAAQKNGMEFWLGHDLKGRVVEAIVGSMSFVVEFFVDQEAELYALLERIGHVPLPPYIRRPDEESDKGRYQTVYAKNLGSVAAPTAGLHYSQKILDQLRAKGISTAFVNLHVGLGTFQPIKADTVTEHRMHKEMFFVPQSVRDQVLATKKSGGRVIAVGTTSTRSLESAARGFEGETELYLYPGEKFLWVDAMQTNFHQPKSSLLVMMAAFMGKELLFRAYDEAIKEKYRFLSYGDTMLVL